jgi:hypothetical protein
MTTTFHGKPPTADGERFVVTFAAKAGVDGARALRAVLKLAGRYFGLRCTAACRENRREDTVNDGAVSSKALDCTTVNADQRDKTDD